jgi:hypothetical protein
LIALLVGLVPATVRAAEDPPLPASILQSPGTRGEAVKVERARPDKAKRPTLKFLRENRDFLRGRVDGLTEVLRDSDGGDFFDPAHLDYLRRLRAAEDARDSLLALGRDLRRTELLAEIAELARFESDLDLVEQLLLEQGRRLDRLEADFAGRQETGLLVLVEGHPAESAADSLVLVDGFGHETVYTFDALKRESLRTGALARIYHRFIEPRDQALTLQLRGGETPAVAATIELAPDHHRLNVLVLNFDGVDREHGILGLEARTWSEAPFVERVALRGEPAR